MSRTITEILPDRKDRLDLLHDIQVGARHDSRVPLTEALSRHAEEWQERVDRNTRSHDKETRGWWELMGAIWAEDRAGLEAMVANAWRMYREERAGRTWLPERWTEAPWMWAVLDQEAREAGL